MLDKLKNIKRRFDELTAALNEIGAGRQEYVALAKERSALEPIIGLYGKYSAAENDALEAEKMLAQESDQNLADYLGQEMQNAKALAARLLEDLKIMLLPADPDDDKNVIIEVRAGAGGDEAALFAAQLMRMYKMYAAIKGWRVEDMDVSQGELGGLKEVSFSIAGRMIYSMLKFESGVHRVQRVPATENQGRIHTSTVTVAVLPEAEDVKVEINEKDLKTDTYRSGGAGGQHVNKTESAIRITHMPTGIVVACQDERSQIKNRDKAMKMLRAKLYDRRKAEADKNYAGMRRAQVGTGDRSERIRTYNFPQGRVTDHRIGLSVHNIEAVMNGDLDELVEALRLAERAAKLANA